MARGSHRPDPPETGSGSARGRAEPFVLVLSVLALALGLVRFHGLSTWSLWLDEALTLADARGGAAAHNPLGYRLFDAFYRLFPGQPSERVLRLPAALAGWLVLPAMWLAWRGVVGARARALAMLFVALSTWAVYWSQNARFYTLAQLAAVIGGGLVLAGARRGSPARILLGFGAVALGAAAHPSVAFFGAGLFLAAWLASAREPAVAPARGARVALFLVAGCALALGLRWGLSVWERWEANKGAADPKHFVLTTGYLLTPLLGLAWALGSARVLWRGPARERPAVLVGVLGMLLALAASCVSRMSAQYVFVLLPWLALGAALALDGAPRRAGWLALAIALPLAVETALYASVRHGDRPRWREAYEHVFDRRGPLDLVLGMEAPVGEYYLEPYKATLREWRGVSWLDAFRPRTHEAWARYRRPIWLILNQEQLEDWQPEDARALRRFLEESCEREALFAIPWTPRDLDVLVYRWPGAP